MKNLILLLIVGTIAPYAFALKSTTKLSPIEKQKIKRLRISDNTPVILDWDSLYRLNPKERGVYIKQLVIQFSKVRAYSKRDSTNRSKFMAILQRLFPEAYAEAADDIYEDVRIADNNCIYAGNVSEYRDGNPGDVRCKPPESISFCGKEYRCPTGQVPCNPMLFGFEENNYAYIFNNREIRKEDGKYLVTVPSHHIHGIHPDVQEQQNSGTAGNLSYQLEDTEVYKTPRCVPQAMDATQACHAQTDMHKDWYYEVGYMLSDMKSLGCDIKTEWNNFAEAAQHICDTDENRRQATLSNLWSECQIVAARLRILHEEYAQTDVGESLPLNQMQPGFEFIEQ